MVVGVGHDAPVLQLPSHVRIRAYDTVTKLPIPCACYESFKKFKSSAS